MFQPNPKPLISNLVKSKVVPAWVLAAIVATQISVNLLTQSNEPKCKMVVQLVHESSYSKRLLQLSEAKFKVSTNCDMPQTKTSITAYFEEKLPDGTRKIVKTINGIVIAPAPTTPNYVLIKSITAPCNGKGRASYFGRAEGEVLLRDGQVEHVSGESQESKVLNCQISAE